MIFLLFLFLTTGQIRGPEIPLERTFYNFLDYDVKIDLICFDNYRNNSYRGKILLLCTYFFQFAVYFRYYLYSFIHQGLNPSQWLYNMSSNELQDYCIIYMFRYHVYLCPLLMCIVYLKSFCIFLYILSLIRRTLINLIIISHVVIIRAIKTGIMQESKGQPTLYVLISIPNGD